MHASKYELEAQVVRCNLIDPLSCMHAARGAAAAEYMHVYRMPSSIYNHDDVAYNAHLYADSAISCTCTHKT